LTPLVYQARDWSHGVLVGASVASETTAAATGEVGVVRRDPMAMKPFTGYNYGDYFGHWLDVGAKLKKPPQIFHVNWFRQAANGDFLWPGFGDNLRVLSWIIDRCTNRVGARDTAIGFLPEPSDLNLQGLNISAEVMQELTTVHVDAWKRETAEFRKYLQEYGTHMPARMLTELATVEQRLNA
jgi:phosphoenolpyruvate carboxykinase (GTP)